MFGVAGIVARNVLCPTGFGVEVRGVDMRGVGVGSGALGAGTVSLACTF
jgi:hypothetical protein